MNYLQVLLLARETSEAEVVPAIKVLLASWELPRFERVLALARSERPARPQVDVGEMELATYNGLTPEALAEAKR